eukprot:gene15206-biopygen15283
MRAAAIASRQQHDRFPEFDHSREVLVPTTLQALLEQRAENLILADARVEQMHQIGDEGLRQEPRPYRHSPIFDAANLPAALTRTHTTKAGVWAKIEIIDGRLRFRLEDGRTQVLTPEQPGLIEPEQPHSIAIEDPATRFRIAFYDRPPGIEEMTHEPQGSGSGEGEP